MVEWHQDDISKMTSSPQVGKFQVSWLKYISALGLLVASKHKRNGGSSRRRRRSRAETDTQAKSARRKMISIRPKVKQVNKKLLSVTGSCPFYDICL